MSDPRIESLRRGLERLQSRHGVFVLECGFGEIVTLVSQVQLALRQVAGLLRLGYDPRHDVAVCAEPPLTPSPLTARSNER